jgi:cell division protein FtsW
MMLYRRNRNFFTNWLTEIDAISVISIFILTAIGGLLVTTSSPSVAVRIGLPPFYFMHRQLLFLALGIVIMLSLTTLQAKQIKQLSLAMFALCLLLMILVLFVGQEVKGAKRWISIFGFSLQPSELMKPFFSVLMAIFLAGNSSKSSYTGYIQGAVLYIAVVALLLLQPDFGMTVSFSAVTFVQMFIAGLPLIIMVGLGVVGIFGLVMAYFILPHVAKRIDSFLNPEQHENYQVDKSLEAFANGGILGVGPGEGHTKQSLPDSHTDFIFAVAGEEFGALFCLAVLILYAFIIFRFIMLAMRAHDMFTVYAVAGLLMHFTFQTVFNIGVTLNLLPTKGMTLPFISYGGSSTLSFAIIMGICLCLTKRGQR